MMRTRLHKAAVLALVVGLAATTLAKTKIQTQKSETFDFSRLKTWAWNPNGPGDVKIWLTAESKSEPVKRQYEPSIMEAIERELGRLGFTKAAGAADFNVTYYVLITSSTNAQELGQFLPAVTQWGLPPISAQTTALKIYPLGSFVLDVASPDPSNVVFRAVAQSEVDLEKTEDQRKARIQTIVRDILAKLPRKK
jgi:hypothetical protein